MDELVDLIAGRIGLNESEIGQVLRELRDAVILFNPQGRSLKLEGLGIYTPTINPGGTFGIGHRADIEINNCLNAPGAFQCEIENGEDIGKTDSVA